LSSEDTFGAWLEECVIVEAAARCKSSSAYHNFKRWAEQAGEYVPSQKRFSQKLQDRGFTMSRSSTARQFVGLRLKIDDVDPRASSGWLPPDE
jgi:putative DNA primase/helicase